MKSVRKVAVAIALSIMLTLSPILSGVAYAMSNEVAVEVGIENSPTGIDDERYGEIERAEDNENVEEKEKEIEIEEKSKRTKYGKEYKLTDGSNLMVIYPEAVHYEKDGEWEEIDNSLKLDEKSGKYSNKCGIWDVEFPATYEAGENTVKIKREESSIGFGIRVTGENEGNKEEIVYENEIEEETAEKEEDVTEEEGTIEEKIQNEVSEEEDEIEEIDSAEDNKEERKTILLSRENHEKEMTELQRKTIPEKLESGIEYTNVYKNIDIRYELISETLKEEIIFKKKPEKGTEISFDVEAEGIVLKLQPDGSINGYRKESEEIEYYLPAPFLYDANGEYTYDVKVELNENEKGYEIIYELPSEWLEDEKRAYPVTVDPVVKPALTTGNIRDKQVDSLNNSVSYTSSYIEAGYHSTNGIERIFLMYRDLPELTSADVLTNAAIQIYRPYSSSTESQMNVHKVLDTWDSTTLQWSNKPGYNPLIEDYAMVSGKGWYTWDVTDIAREWYEDENTGMMFKLTDAVENAGRNLNKTFYSSDGGSSYRPILYISYVSGSGLEGYWDYHSQSAGRAGTGYVNDYTGSLVWISEGLGFSGNRMPVSINVVYNSNNRVNTFGIGNGWRTNYNQQVYEFEDDDDYYIWEDEDGTLHYFKYSSSYTYKDESGLELTLKTNGSGNTKYSIKDKNNNASYFDTNGRLTKIENNQATKSRITITYTSSSSKKISSVTDGAGRVYAFNYTNNLLSSIVYKGTGSTAIKTITYSHDNGNIDSVTYPDGETVSYTYIGDNLLSRANDVDGYNVRYTYSKTTSGEPNRVIKIEEYDNLAEGGSIEIEYAHNQTTYRDYLGNVQIEQFNDYGNLVSIQDDEGRAQYARYAKDADNNGKANQMVLSSKLQNTVKNYVMNSSFETDDYWRYFYSVDPNGSFSFSSSEKYLGQNSLAITRGNNNGAHFVQPTVDEFVTVEPGKTYTLSCYVKTSGMSGGGSGARIVLELVGASGSIYSEPITHNTDWTRVEISYTHPEDASVCQIKWALENGTLGTAYFDCAQFEKTATASRYNLVENGDFTIEGNASSTAYGWSYGTELESGDVFTTVTDNAAPQLDGRVFKFEGEVGSKKRVYQDIPISGNRGDVFTLSGWGKMDAAPNTGTDRFIAIMLRFYGEDDSMWAAKVPFNTDADSDINWQYASQKIIADMDYRFVRVLLIYEKNVNTAYFDGIQLFKEEFGNSYVYDSNGNVTSVKDLQANNTRYEYTGNDMTKMTLPSGAKQTYTYDSYHNVKTATSDRGVKSSFTYDTYGNNTEVMLGTSTLGIESTSVYTTDGNQVSSITDALGNTTTYGYDSETSQLSWVQLPGENTSERTNYTYDTLLRPTTISKNVSGLSGGNSAVTNSYTYEDDQLKTLTHSNTSSKSTTYTFGYGNFGLTDYIRVGLNRTLVSYQYKTSDNSYMPERMTYGNGDYVTYSYDNKGRIKGKSYSDSNNVVEYIYDNNGNLGTVKDGLSGRSTKYLYDQSERMMQIEEKGNGVEHSIRWGYDSNNNLSTQKESINGEEHNISYTYDRDNRPTQITDGNVSTTYTYDTLSRVTGTEYKNGSNTVIRQTPSYKAKDSTHTSTQVESWRIQSGSYDKTASYTYDVKGNITSITFNGKTTSYVYDGLSQLIRENNEAAGKTWTYSYDAGGNIALKKEYTYTTGTLGTAIDTIVYGYTDNDWGDLLTSYDGQTIASDAIGNMLSDGTWTYTWEQGRQLKAMSDGTTNLSFIYDEEGKRVSKTVGSTVWHYVYNGSNLVYMTDGMNYLYFSYDATGVIGFEYNSTQYYYLKNAQGDVIGIADNTGTVLVEYTYDAWGKQLSVSGTLASTVGEVNQIRYRGYYYDTETGLYYVSSRYYDPEVGRFINADEIDYLGADGELLSFNLFAYCQNNPVNRTDEGGNLSLPNWAKVSIGAVAIAGLAVATACTGGAAVVICGAALSGAIAGGASNAILGAISGGISGGWQGALDGACSGFMSGTLIGGVAGAASAGLNIATGATTVAGNAHGSTLHKLATNMEAGKMVASGRYSQVGLNKALKTMGLNGTSRPDVIGIAKKGANKLVEVVSPRQSTELIISKMNNMISNNPGTARKIVTWVRKLFR